MKGQTTLEFIGSALFFIIVVLGLFAISSNELPKFYDSTEITEKNLEAKYMTDYLLTSDHTSEPGFVNEYMRLDKKYIQEDIATANNSLYNSTKLTQDLDLEHRYNIRISWYPVVETPDNFIRSQSPSFIQEPSNLEYSKAQNTVYYGNITLHGSEEQFLITAKDSEYVNVYHQKGGSWDFSSKSPKNQGDYINTSNAGNFTLRSIQNRPKEPGSMLILSRSIKFADGRNYFGSDRRTAEGEVIKMSRYPILEDSSGSNEIAKMEVLVW